MTNTQRNIRTLLLALGLVCLWSCKAGAANHYIREAASGTADGSDWNNAWTNFPSFGGISMTRGDTYYVADGFYSTNQFSKALSGTSVITIKKATASDHGTETGWNSAYGDGQATFAEIQFNTSYWVFDGATKDTNNWWDSTAYGFRVDQYLSDFTDPTEQGTCVRYGNLGYSVDHVDLTYTCLSSRTNLPAEIVGWYVAYIYKWGGPGTFSNLTIADCLFRYGSVPIFVRDTTNMLVERCAFESNESNVNNHGEVVSGYFTVDGFFFRKNKMRNIHGTALLAVCAENTSSFADSWEMSDCLAYNIETGDGVFGFSGDTARFTNTRIIGNTFADKLLGGDNCGVAIPEMAGSNNIVANNLWFSAATNFWHGGNCILLNNAYSWPVTDSNSLTSVDTAQTNLTSAIFTDYANDDFRLASATVAGTNQASWPTDLNGVTRGGDGTWDRGAFEYAAGGGGGGTNTGNKIAAWSLWNF